MSPNSPLLTGFLRKALVSLFVLWTGVLWAGERELHVVAVHRGWSDAGDFLAEPQATVIVDRPGGEVVLVLLDAGQVAWTVETTPGTFIENVIRGGADPSDSRVLLSGIEMPGATVSGVPLAIRPLGKDFRQLLDRLADLTGLQRISSFQGSYSARESAFSVDQIDLQTDGLARDYLIKHLADPASLPVAIRHWADGSVGASDYTTLFDKTGMTLTGPHGTEVFPLTGDVPIPVLPSGSFFDAASQTLFGITYGGDGILYRVDTRTGDWSVVTGLQGYDAAGLFYDGSGDRFILTGAFSRPGDIRILQQGDVVQSVSIPVWRFPGLTDLFNYGNESAPPLTPRSIQDGWLFLEAYGDAGVSFRRYAVHLETEDVRLLEFRNEKPE